MRESFCLLIIKFGMSHRFASNAHLSPSFDLKPVQHYVTARLLKLPIHELNCSVCSCPLTLLDLIFIFLLASFNLSFRFYETFRALKLEFHFLGKNIPSFVVLIDLLFLFLNCDNWNLLLWPRVATKVTLVNL